MRNYLPDAITLPSDSSDLPDDAAGIHLPYREFELAWIEPILAFEGIAQANGALGLPWLQQPIRLGSGREAFAVFPITSFIRHVEGVIPDLSRRAAALGSVGDLYEELDRENSPLSPAEDLTLAILEIAQFCEAHQLPLLIRY